MEMLEMMGLGFAEEDRIDTKEEPLTLTEEFFVSVTLNLAEREEIPTDDLPIGRECRVAGHRADDACAALGARRYRTFLVCSEEVRDFR